MAYVGKSKINSSKSYLHWELNMGPLEFYSDTFLTELTLCPNSILDLNT